MANPEPMDDHDCQPEPLREPRVQYQGPFTHHDVVVSGWRVPLVQAHVDEDTGDAIIVLDRRIALELTAVEAERFVPFLADAIAVPLGYGAHPREDTPRPLARAPYPRIERVVDIDLQAAG